MEDIRIRKLNKKVEVLRKQNKELKKRLRNVEKITERYRRSPFDCIFRMVRRIVNRIRLINRPSVSVIIPTFRQNGLIDECVTSVLNQKYCKRKINVLIVHNGEEQKYYEQLIKKYNNNKNTSVLHCDAKGAAAAREYAKKYVRTQWMMFLDDDDYITPGYINDLFNCTYDKRVKIVCGKLNDLHDSNVVNKDTYINRGIKKAGNGIVNKYGEIKSCFATVCGKLYDTRFFTNELSEFDTSLTHTEDVAFWVSNMAKIPNDAVWSCATSKEAYIRRVRENSTSRPSENELFNFMCQEQLYFAERYTKVILDNSYDLEHKKFVLYTINAINSRMRLYYDSLDDEKKEKYRQIVLNSSCPFINKSFFGKKTGIAFCHNFAPAIDASAFVATKRLSQISDHFGCGGIDWTVVTADMSRVREQDELWDEFYAKFQYSKLMVVGVDTSFRPTIQDEWGNSAYMRVRDKHVDYVYSRSMWIGSHIAAYRYKKSHKDVIWIAEFSDPIAMGIDNKPKDLERNYIGEMEIFNDYYSYVENLVYEAADNIIFTNDNQLKYMLEYSGNANNLEVKRKALVWEHPIISKDYAQIISHGIQINKKKINIAFFGTFYKNRNAGVMLNLLENEDVELHIFTKQTIEVKQLALKHKNLKTYSFVPLLEMYSIIKDMDYCFVNDVSFDGDINPYLPSKLADYLSVGCSIIAHIIGNSPMRDYDNKRIIKVEELDNKFVKNLKKQRQD